MKILVLTTALVIFFCQFTIADIYNQKDGIDKRIKWTKQLLSKKMTTQQINALLFNEAVIHTKDSMAYYIKIPYKNTKRNGFLIARNVNGNLDCVELTLQGYKFKDTALANYFPVVSVSYPLDKRPTRTFISNKKGLIEKVIVKRQENYIMDSIYKVVSLFMLSSNDNISFEAYLNVSLLFDNIDTLNSKARNDGIIIQDLIPLRFNWNSFVDFEFSNSNVLPAIDLKEAFKRFDSKQDSIKN